MILVSLIGDFDSNVLPIFFHYAEEIRIHILLHDKRRSDTAHARNIEAGMKRFCAHYRFEPLLLRMEYDEDDKTDIEDVFSRIEKFLRPSEALLFNGSDGLMSTTALIQPLLFACDGQLIAYDRHDNTCNILSKEEMRKELISPMTVNEHLMLKNIDFEFTAPEGDLAVRKESVLTIMRDMQRYNRFKLAHAQKRPTEHYGDIIGELRNINRHEDSFYIQGGLFEEYCYHLVSDLGFDDVKLGTLVTYNPQSPKAFKNELDLLCIKENHLHIIECKFRTFVNGEGIVYKYDAVMDLLDSDGKVMIVAVGGRNEQPEKNRVQFRDATKYRAQQNNIAVYQEEVMDAERFRREVQRFLLSSDA